MLGMNRVTLLGHAGRNPEIRKLPSGEDVAQFSLATTERFRRKDDTLGESTEWHAIVAFGGAAEATRKLVRKGDAVLVEGRIASRSWTDRTGAERRSTEIVVSGSRGQVNVLTKRRKGSSGNNGDDDPPGGAAAGGAAGRESGTADADARAGCDSSRGGAGPEPDVASDEAKRSASAEAAGRTVDDVEGDASAAPAGQDGREARAAAAGTTEAPPARDAGGESAHPSDGPAQVGAKSDTGTDAARDAAHE